MKFSDGYFMFATECEPPQRVRELIFPRYIFPTPIFTTNYLSVVKSVRKLFATDFSLFCDGIWPSLNPSFLVVEVKLLLALFELLISRLQVLYEHNALLHISSHEHNIYPHIEQ